MNNIRVIVSIPPISMDILTGKYGKFWNIGSSMPPQGLCRIAAICREKGYETKILDCQVMRLTSDEAVKNILEFDPAFVGISSSSVSIIAAGQFAKKIKEQKPSIMTVIGGPHISALPAETLNEFDGFDAGVIGEGDVTFHEMIEAALNHSNFSDIKGLVWRENGRIKINAPRSLIKDLDSLPMPAWDMLPKLSRYYRTSAQRSKEFPVAAILTSRGCPFNCSFCDKSVFGQSLRAHGTGYVMEMIKILKYAHGIRALVFNDDLFFANKRRLKEICETMIRDNLKIAWSCNGRINMLDLETLKLMRRAGCWQIALGIESGDQKVLEQMNKKIHLEVVPEAVRLIKRAGISVKAFFMFGMPIETKKTIEKTIEFAKKIPIDDAQFSPFTPYPGSEMYKYVVEREGFKPQWDKMNTVSPFYVPKSLTMDDLVYYQRKAIKDFYFRFRPLLNQLLKFKNPRYAINVTREAFYLLNYLYRRD